MNYKLFCVLASIMLAGCVAAPYTPLDKSKGGPGAETAALTEPIVLVADTQFHESRGVASRPVGLSGDEFVDVTVRSAQQVIGAADVLKFALQRSAQFRLVIHAGDAIDVSCDTEWNHFKDIMRAGRGPSPGSTTWMFAPGNHDGFFTGNIFPKEKGWYRTEYWLNMCNAGRMWANKDSRLYDKAPKNKIISQYIKMLGGEKGADGWARGCTADKAVCWSAFTSEIEPWKSFLMQRVLLPQAPDSKTPVYALLLDTSNYDQRPYLFSFAAGVRGDISYVQMQEVTSLTKALPSYSKYFFIAHHPTSDWRASNWDSHRREAWKRLVHDARSLQFLVSAHTHEGSLRQTGTELANIVELNIGSLADAPVYMRSLDFRINAVGRIGFRSEAIKLNPDATDCDLLEPQASKKGSEYGVDTQRSENARASERPALLRYAKAARSALGNFIRQWQAKHKELRPQLLAYADIVDKTMPEDVQFSYRWGGMDNTPYTEDLRGRMAISSALRKHANCTDGVGQCSVQAKGSLLLALENYYWRDGKVPADVKQKAHTMRLCMAIAAAAESPTGGNKKNVLRIDEEISVPWTVWLTP